MSDYTGHNGEHEALQDHSIGEDYPWTIKKVGNQYWQPMHCLIGEEGPRFYLAWDKTDISAHARAERWIADEKRKRREGKRIKAIQEREKLAQLQQETQDLIAERDEQNERWERQGNHPKDVVHPQDIPKHVAEQREQIGMLIASQVAREKQEKQDRQERIAKQERERLDKQEGQESKKYAHLFSSEALAWHIAKQEQPKLTEYSFLVPNHAGQGTPFFTQLEDKLVDTFGGFTRRGAVFGRWIDDNGADIPDTSVEYRVALHDIEDLREILVNLKKITNQDTYYLTKSSDDVELV